MKMGPGNSFGRWLLLVAALLCLGIVWVLWWAEKTHQKVESLDTGSPIGTFAPSNLPLDARCHAANTPETLSADMAKLRGFYHGAPEPTVDCNNDGAVNLKDVAAFSLQYGLVPLEGQDPSTRVLGTRYLEDDHAMLDVMAPRGVDAIELFLRIPDAASAEVLWFTGAGEWTVAPTIRQGFLQGVWMSQGVKLEEPLVRVRLPTDTTSVQGTFGMEGVSVQLTSEPFSLTYEEREGKAPLPKVSLQAEHQPQYFIEETVIGTVRIGAASMGGQLLEGKEYGWRNGEEEVLGTTIVIPEQNGTVRDPVFFSRTKR